MPVITLTTDTRVSALWGTSWLRGADGRLHPLRVGQTVHRGDIIVTEEDAIAELSVTSGDGATGVAAADAKDALDFEAPAAGGRTSAADAAIQALESGELDASPAAGLTAGPQGALAEGLRIERISEGVTAGGMTTTGIERPDLTIRPLDVVPVRPALSVADATIVEAAGTLGFVVRLSAPSTGEVTVTYQLRAGSAHEGSDYTPVTGTLTFAPGVTEMRVDVPIVDDARHEDGETFTIVLADAVGAPIARASAVGTIVDDDAAPVVSSVSPVGGATVTEGTPAQVAVTLSGVSDTPMTYPLQLGGGSAGAADHGAPTFSDGVTYDAATGTITVPAGVASFTMTVPTTDDALDEADETLPVTVGGVAAAVTIVDNDAPPSLSIGNVSVNEAAGVATFTVRLSGASALPISVAFATRDGSAGAADYGAVAGTLQFAPGVTTQTVTVAIAADSIHEGSEAFTVELSSPVNAQVAIGQGVGTIIDDDATPAVASLGSASTVEGGTLDYAVVLTNASSTPTTLAFALGGGTASAGDIGAPTFTNGVTFDPATGTITVPAGITAFSVRVPTIDDALQESSETVPLTVGTATALGTIADNDGVPTVTAVEPGALGSADDAVIEGRPLVYAVTLSHPSATPTTLAFTLGGGSASAADFGTPTFTNGVTYDAATGTITVPPGVTSFAVNVPTTPDLLDEVDESVPLAIGGVAATGTIVDDDATPSLSIGDVTVNEAAGTATFTVTLSAPSGLPVTVGYATSDATATASADYTATSGTLTFAPGVTTQTITVAIANDTIFEPAETFAVTLSGPTNATLADGQAIGTIADNDGAPTVTAVEVGAPGAADDAVTEGSPLVYTVTLSNASSTPTTLPFAVGGGSASAADIGVPTFTNGVTFDAATGTITVPAGVTSFAINLRTTQDLLDEPNETVPVSVGGVAATGTIVDDDATPGLAIGDVTVDESAGTATFTVTLSAPSAQTVAVGWNTSDASATAGADYTAASGRLTFAPGVTMQTVTVAITSDTIHEGSEAFTVVLSGPTNAQLVDGAAIGTIVDDDAVPTVTAVTLGAPGTADDVAVEGTALVYDVTLSNASSTPTTLPFALGGGTASAADIGMPSFTNGVTWDAVSGTITVPAGVTAFAVSVPTTKDALDETDETVALTIGGIAATGTIVDDDATPSLSIGDVTVNEAAGTATFTVTLSAPSGLPVTVGYATSDATATASADYTATSGTLTFAPGVTTQTITVAISNDTIFEPAETFAVTLSGPTNATLADGQAIGTIADNDNAPTVTAVEVGAPGAADDTVTEGSALVYTVTLSNASSTPTTLPFAFGGGSASAADIDVPTFTNGVTFDAATGTITVPAGVTSFAINLPTTQDLLDEPDETVPVSVGGVAATGTIVDDDATPGLAIGDVTVDEAAGTATFTVTLSAPSDQAVTVGWNTGDASATAGADYTAASGTLTFAPGVTTQTVTVAITSDTIHEGSEAFTVVLSGPTNAQLVDGAAIGTIVDDDAVPTVTAVTLGAPGTADDTAVEGTALVYDVTLSNASSTSTTLPFAFGGGSASAADIGTPTFTNGVTWDPATGTVTVPAGVTTFAVSVPTTQDTLNEPDESVPLTVGGVSATGTIIDDDGKPQLAIGDVVVNEAAGTATFTVTLSAASGLPVTVGYATSDATATAGADYTPTAGTLTFAPGVTTQTITVAIADDTVFESGETFAVTLSSPTNALIADNRGIGTITDNDAAPTVTAVGIGAPGAADDLVTEGSALVYGVTLSNASSTPTTLPFAFGGGSASAADIGVPTFTNGVTFDAATGTITVPAGVTTFAVSIPTAQDLLDEPNETVAVSVGGRTATGTIIDDDAAPALSIGDVTVDEAAGTATFTVTLSAPSGQAVTVGWGTGDATATAGADYTAASGMLTFAPGVTTQTITVAIANDATFEGSESFAVTLSAPTNAQLVDGAAVGTITDDDMRPSIASVEIGAPGAADDRVTEGGTLVATVTLTNPSASATTFPFTLGGGTASSADFGTPTFTNGVTYDAATGTITVPPGVTSFAVNVPTTPDLLDEVDESVPLAIGGVAATGTIVDDDATPSLSIGDVTVNEAAGTATFTVTLSAPSGLPVTVGYATSDATATASADYTATSGTLTFAPGVTTQTITVAIADDTIFEPAETFAVTLSGPTNATLADGQAIGTIADNDGAPTVTAVEPGAADDAVTEGSPLVYTVTLSNASSTPTTLPFAFGGGSASAADIGVPSFTNGVTFDAATGTITVPAGVTSFAINLPTTQDLLDEPDETVPVSVGGVAATGTIVDDDATPTLSVADVTVSEASGTATFTVTLSAPSAMPVTVGYATADASATAGADYTAAGGMLTFAPGVTTQTVTIAITNDTVSEATETLRVNLSGATNAIVLDGLAIGTIIDNDGTPSVASVEVGAPGAADDSVTEGTALAYTVTLTNASTSPLTFSFALGGGSASAVDIGTPTFTNGVTYDAASGTVTVPPGVTSFTVQVPTTQDLLDETNETVPLQVGGISATGTIVDDDATPSLSIGDVTVDEAAGTATFTVTLSAASGLPITVGYATGDASATAGSDYTATSGTLSFAPGVTTQTVTVAIANDTVFEAGEIFAVTLAAPTNATLADGAAVGTIVDNDALPTIATVDVGAPGTADDTVIEGATLTWNVTLTNASATPTSFAFTLGGGTAAAADIGSPSFTNGVTYDAASGTITVPAGVTAFAVSLPTTQDLLDEPNETVTLSVGGKAATGTIIDDDATPSLAIGDVTVNEVAGTATFTVTLSAPSGQAVTVGYATGDASATAGSDYAATSGTLTFAPGVTTQTVTVAIANDTVFEASETFAVTLAAPTNATLADGAAVGTIVDNDAAPTVASIEVGAPGTTDDAVTEGGTLVFNVTLTNASSTPTTLPAGITGGSATSADYGSATFTNGVTFDAVTGTLTVPAGVTSFAIALPTTQDLLDEPNETVTLDVGGMAATGTIVDDDATPSLAIGDVTVNESAGTATFTVTLSAPSGQAVTVGYATGDASAAAGSDYTAIAGTLTFAPGVTTQTVTVSIANDIVFEPSETFTVTLAAPTNATLADGLAVGTIVDNDPAPTVAAIDGGAPGTADDAVIEGATLTWNVTLSNASATPTTLPFALGGGSAATTDYGTPSFTNGVTYDAAAGTITVPAGVTSFAVNLPTTQDLLDEPNETVAVSVGGRTATGTIIDDDAAPALSIGDVTVDEAAGTATFTVSLSAPSGQPVSVGYATSDGTAVAGADYASATGTLTFAPGVTTQTITVAITNDTTFEPGETFAVTLSSPTNATLADGQAVGTITDNDAAPTIAAIEIGQPGAADDAVTEGQVLTYAVTLTNAASTPTTYAFALGGGTAAAGDFGAPTFTNGVTYDAATGTITVPAGVTSFALAVPTTQDLLDEANETIPLAIGGRTATGTIVDDDATPTLAIDDVTVDESAGTATFTVTLSAPSGQTVSVGYGTGDTTATAGSDYTAATGTLTFAPGVTSQTITVAIADDRITEVTETFRVVLSGAVNATLADPTGLGSISDNDAAPVIDLDRDDSAGVTGTGYATTFTENGAAVALADVDLRIGDVDSTLLAGATVTLQNAQPGDVLAAGTLPAGITASIAGHVVTLAGTATAADYEAAIRALTYANTSEAPDATPRTVTIAVTDGNTWSVPATTTIQVVPVNDAPVANPDAASVGEDASVSGQVLANDTDVDGDRLAVTGVTGLTDGTTSAAAGSPLVGQYGTLTIAADGTWTYVPNAAGQAADVGETLVDRFCYAITDNAGGDACAQLTITIIGANDAPVVIADSAVTAEDTPVAGNVLANDTDPDVEPLAVTGFSVAGLPGTYSAGSSATIAGVGTITIAGDGAWTFVPSLNWNGTVPAVTYVASDGTASRSGTLSIGVTPVNDPALVTAAASTISEEGLVGANADTSGTTDTTNARSATGTIGIADVDGSTFTVTLTAPTTTLTSNGQPITWTGAGTGTLVGSAGGSEVIRASIDATGRYTVTLSNQVDHATAGVEDLRTFGIGVAVLDAGGATTTSTISVTVEDDAPVFTQSGAAVVTLQPFASSSATGDLGLAIGADDGSLAKAVMSGVSVDANGYITATHVGEDGAIVTTYLTYEHMRLTYQPGPTPGSLQAVATDGTVVYRVQADPVTSQVTVTNVVAPDMTSYTASSFGQLSGGNTPNTYLYGDTRQVFSIDVVGTSAGAPSTVNTNNGYFGVANNFIDSNETLTLKFHDAMTAIGLKIDNLGTGETLVYQAWNAAGQLVGTGSIAGTGSGGTTMYASFDASTFAGCEFRTITFSSAGASNYRVGLTSVTGLTPVISQSTQLSAIGVDSDGDATAGSRSVNVVFDAAVPHASPDVVTTWQDASVSGNLLANDSTSTGTLAVTGFTVAGGSGAVVAAGQTATIAGVGDIHVDANGAWSFTPAAGFSGQVPGIIYTVSNGTQSATSSLIVSVTPNPSVSIGDVVVNEGAGTATFTVTLSGPATRPISVNFATSNDTAAAGSDYTATSGTLTFAPGVTTQTVTVAISDDTVAEGTETFKVTLSGATNASVADGLGIGTITDNDAAPRVTAVEIGAPGTADDAVTEGGTLNVNVTLSNASSTPTTLPFALGGGTASAADVGTPTFTNGVTYDAASGTITVPAGVTAFVVNLPTTQDLLDEPNETVPVRVGGVVATGTIIDDDATPSLAVGDVTVNEAAGTATFTVTLSAPSGQAVTVGYATGDTSATAGSDYTATSGTLTFAPGVTTQTVTVAITNDTVFEASETFAVTLAAPTNATLADGAAVGTIVDNDAAPTVASIEVGAPGTTDDAVTEGGTLVFNVTLTNASSTPMTLPAGITGGSATSADYGSATFSNGVTFDAATGTLTVPAGVTSFAIALPTTQDLLDEPNETVTLGVGGKTATGTIVDDDATPSLAIGDVTVNEAAGTATFTVTLSAPSGQAVTVGYATGDTTAVAGSDYVATTGTLSFAPGVTTQTITVAIGNDTTFEPSETFAVTLSGPTNATLADGLAVGTIVDNDAAPAVASIEVGAPGTSDDAVIEGATLVYNVTLTNASSTPTTLPFALGGGTATPTDVGTPAFTNGVTYDAATGTITVPAGVTAFAVNLPTTQDLLDEPNETVAVSVGGRTATGTIVDDDATPQLSIGTVTVNEGAGTATFTVSLSAPSGQPVSVAYGTADATATAGSDYTATSGTLTFAPGVTTQTVTVAITDDTLAESGETFRLLLSSPTNATLASAGATANIIDNDAGPTIATVEVGAPGSADDAVPEGNALVFNVTLTNASASATSYPLSIGGGTAAATDVGSATFTAGVTFDAASGRITVPAGVTSFAVILPTTQDTLDEPDETVTIQIGGVEATGTIVDDDAAPSLAIGDVTVNEAAGTATFTVTLSAPSGQAVTVGYATGDATATAGADYTPTTGTLTFAPGVTTQTVTVAISNDTTFEPSETFTVTLSAPTNATLADGSAVGTITDNEAAPTVTAVEVGAPGTADDTVTEGAALTWNVTLSNASATATVLPFTLGGGSAAAADIGTPTFTNGVTWNAAAGTVTVPAGVTSFAINVPTTQDALDEANETVPLTIGGRTATGTIVDDDATPSLAIGDVTVNESAGTATFTVTLSAPSGQAVTVGYATGDATAVAGSDYVATTGTLTFAPGVTTQTITVAISNDTTFEPSESIAVTLSGPTNATLADGLAVGTIVDNDSAPAVASIEVGAPGTSDDAVAEGATLVYNVTLTNASSTPTTLPAGITGGTATTADYGTATFTNGVTFDAATGTLTIPAGVTAFSIRLPTTQDVLDEPDETVTLSVGGRTATGTILDDDAAPALSIGDVTIDEAAGTATFTVTLGAVSGQAVSVAWATADGSATAGSDYTAATGSLTFAPGVTSQTVTVAITNDLLPETGETLRVVLSAPVNATIANATGIATILDNDATPTLDLDANDSSGAAGTGYRTTFTENGTPVAIADADLKVADVDTPMLAGATITLGNPQAGDVLSVGTLPAGITATVNGAVVTLSGAASAADYQSAIRAIGYANTTESPSPVDRTVTIAVTDGNTTSAPATTTIAVVPVNDAPVAAPDSAAVAEDATVTRTAATGVLANDTDPDAGDTRTVSAVAFGATSGTVGSALAGTYGSLTLQADGSYVYAATAPAAQALVAGATATETFTYTVRDAAGATSTTTLRFTITGTNDAPVAAPVPVAGVEDTPLVLAWSSFGISDVDSPAASQSITITALPADGVLQAWNGTAWTSVAVGATFTKATIDAGALRFAPDANESGADVFGGAATGNRQADYASFGFTAGDGSTSSAAATMRIDIAPVADAPTVTALKAGPQVIFQNSWETVANSDNSSEAYTGTTLEGWTLVTTGDRNAGGSNSFEIWSANDQQQAQDTYVRVVSPTAGDGRNFLELNDASNMQQTLGIQRSVSTQAGMVYELSFDFAGRPGFSSAYTAFGVYLDGKLLQTFNATSPQTQIDWKNGVIRFVGDGASHTLMLRTDASAFNTGGRGAFLDDMRLTAVEGVVAGNGAGGTTDIALATYIGASLTDVDGSELLSLTLRGAPAGSTIVTASNPGGIAAAADGSITIAASDLASAALHLPATTLGHLSLDITATATETATGATAQSTTSLDLDVLARTAVTDLAGEGLNEYFGGTLADTLNGSTGNDYLMGEEGNDTLGGASGNDVLDGGVGSDILNGGAGNDVLWGGAGNDTLTGGTGADVFAWTLADRGTAGTPAVDTITDFDVTPTTGDTLNLKDLLVGEHTTGGTGNLHDYLDFDTTSQPGRTVIHVSTQGGFTDGVYSAAAEDQRIVLSTTDIRSALGLGGAATDDQILQELLNRNKLGVDG